MWGGYPFILDTGQGLLCHSPEKIVVFAVKMARFDACDVLKQLFPFQRYRPDRDIHPFPSPPPFGYAPASAVLFVNDRVP